MQIAKNIKGHTAACTLSAAACIGGQEICTRYRCHHNVPSNARLKWPLPGDLKVEAMSAHGIEEPQGQGDEVEECLRY